MGGDEFVILLPGMGADASAEKRVELAMAVEGMAAEFPEFVVSVSMGSATYPTDGRNPEQLMGLADRRMYWHKRQYYQARSGTGTAVPA